MALDTAHRASIYQKLLPILGDDDTNALMSEFPATEPGEPALQDRKRAESSLTRGELHDELVRFRSDLGRDLTSLRTDMRREHASHGPALRGQFDSLRAQMTTMEAWLAIGLAAVIIASAVLFVAIGLPH